MLCPRLSAWKGCPGSNLSFPFLVFSAVPWIPAPKLGDINNYHRALPPTCVGSYGKSFEKIEEIWDPGQQENGLYKSAEMCDKLPIWRESTIHLLFFSPILQLFGMI